MHIAPVRHSSARFHERSRASTDRQIWRGSDRFIDGRYGPSNDFDKFGLVDEVGEAFPNEWIGLVSVEVEKQVVEHSEERRFPVGPVPLEELNRGTARARRAASEGRPSSA